MPFLNGPLPLGGCWIQEGFTSDTKQERFDMGAGDDEERGCSTSSPNMAMIDSIQRCT